MDPRILTNPAPSNGIDPRLGNLPASAPPSVGQLASMTPSVSNNVKEPMVNATASYPIFVKPYKNHMERHLHPGDLIWVFTGNSAGNAGASRRGKPCIVANLPILNYFLQEGDTDEHKNVKASEFSDMNNWEWLGVMRNDMQLDGGDPGVGRGSRNPKYQRLINVDVRGATRCFNYWSTAHAGETLYLKIVQRQQKGFIEPASAGGSAFDTGAFTEDDSTPLKARAVIPVPLNGKTYRMDDNITVSNKYDDSEYDLHSTGWLPRHDGLIKIGYCFQHLGNKERVYDRAAVLAATSFQDDRFRLPTIPIFIRT